MNETLSPALLLQWLVEACAARRWSLHMDPAPIGLTDPLPGWLVTVEDHVGREVATAAELRLEAAVCAAWEAVVAFCKVAATQVRR